MQRRRFLTTIPPAAAALTASTASAQRRNSADSLYSTYPVLAHGDREARILSVLHAMERENKTYLSVPVSDGRWLRVLAETANARHIVEVGTSTGYSGLWFSLALDRTGGRLTTHELDPGRAAIARGHFREAGVDGRITVVTGDAHANVAKVDGPVDVVFIDADKEGYVDYLEQLLPKVRPGGLVLAHNLNLVPSYLAAVGRNPALETVYFLAGNELSVTMKKR